MRDPNRNCLTNLRSVQIDESVGSSSGDESQISGSTQTHGRARSQIAELAGDHVHAGSGLLNWFWPDDKLVLIVNFFWHRSWQIDLKLITTHYIFTCYSQIWIIFNCLCLINTWDLSLIQWLINPKKVLLSKWKIRRYWMSKT